ncbi:MAG TPA: Gfo/Idh/MocA family oxidoreductase [Anaerohalosphaeraceae bacterium]|nr:Gfo/Idh/MocA family oxidoreductase [Anaerohalosphaeraceae bacterium]HOL32518.1 Gfo/Idh/MocA family oxidoreductase [Anaerohalosphaeraceae bacterium]HOM76904.1 Gfo/Idh/MocA family oxidoreductase [Anaerohalosphaeraceae bacterium]HPO71079.1 Gfo/Idh/MocA family oxidoreductase [Anaerohalosphaeraceae bacterium]
MRIGIIGFGFMGRMHLGCWSQLPQVEVAAICDANPDIAQTLDAALGNIPGLPGRIDPANLRFYPNIDRMLRAEQLDAVSITLPTYLHAELSCSLLKAGLHVLCEKPMALNTGQCVQMIETARQTGKKLMIAHCIRFWPEYAHTRGIIQSGQYGKVYTARFQRFSRPPAWSSGNWLMDSSKSGGMPLDLHIHDADYIQAVFGMPRAVCSCSVPRDGRIDHIETHYLYDSDMLVTAEASWLASDSFGFRMSYEVQAEHATIVYDSSQSPSYRIFPDDGPPLTPSLSSKDGYFHEIQYFVRFIQGCIEKESMTLQEAMNSVGLIEAELESCKSGQRVELKNSAKRSPQ